MKYKLLISYDGTDFEGWQRQAQGQKTIQSELETAISQICNERVSLIGSGRTDSGVHAFGQVAHFSTEKALTGSFLRSVNSLLPDAISVLKAFEAPEEFHAQKSALSKTYLYKIYNSETPDPLQRRYTTWMKKPISAEKLNEICKPLLGEHDFKSFQTTGTELKTTVRTLIEAQWTFESPKQLVFKITGTGFLKQMVRNIVGTAIYLEQNGLGPQEIIDILGQLDRQAAKMTAPATGLFLYEVHYPLELDNKCREL